MNIGRRHPTLQWTSWWQDSHWRADVVLALIVGAIEIVGTHFAAQHQPDHRALNIVGFALLAAGAAALVFRRHYPGWVLIFVNAITLLYLLLDYPKGPNFLATTIAFFTAVMQGRRLIAWAVLAAEFVLFPWLPYFLGIEPAPTFTVLLGIAGWLFVLATFAELAYIRQQRILRTREEEARRRTGEERLRIARELHDVLGHSISLISVQAGVLTLQIDNEVGTEASRDGIGLGQGILGMQERAAALGGVIEAGPRPDGGFRVFARLPLDGRPLTTPEAGE